LHAAFAALRAPLTAAPGAQLISPGSLRHPPIFKIQIKKQIDAGIKLFISIVVETSAIKPFILPIFQFSLAMVITVLFTPVIISFAKKYRIFDQPDYRSDTMSRKIHKNPTPRIGGAAMMIGFLATALISMNQSPFGVIIFSSILIFLLGLYDDLKNLPAMTRLFCQVAIALGVVVFGDLVLNRIYWTSAYFWQLPYWLGLFLSVFIIVGAINATNMIDGLDGLAGGIILTTTILLCYILFTEFNDTTILIFIGLPLLGALLGFLKYNTHPAAIFMGDGGSNWLGFFSGILILLGTKQLPGNGVLALPLISLLLCFAIPILDTLFVISARLLKGKSPVAPDQLHMHHGLMKLGLNQSQTVTLMYFIAIILGLTGIAPLIFPGYVNWSIPYFAPVLFLLLLYYILKKERSSSPRTPLYRLLADPVKSVTLIGELSFFFGFWERSNRFILYMILILTPILTGGIKNTFIGYLSGILFVVLGILSFSKKHSSGNDFLHSFVLALGALILLISNNLKPISIFLLGYNYNIRDIYNIIFIILTVSILLYIFLTFQKKYLLVTPTDFLMLVLPLILLLFPREIKYQWNLNIIAIRSIVLFVTIRTMIKSHEDFQERIRMIIMISLAFLFFTGALGMRIIY